MSDGRGRLNVRMPVGLRSLVDDAAVSAGYPDTSTWARRVLETEARNELRSPKTARAEDEPPPPVLNLRMPEDLRSLVDDAARHAEYSDTSSWARDVMEAQARKEMDVPVKRRLGAVNGHVNGCIHPPQARDQIGTTVLCRSCQQTIGSIL